MIAAVGKKEKKRAKTSKDILQKDEINIGTIRLWNKRKTTKAKKRRRVRGG